MYPVLRLLMGQKLKNRGGHNITKGVEKKDLLVLIVQAFSNEESAQIGSHQVNLIAKLNLINSKVTF